MGSLGFRGDLGRRFDVISNGLSSKIDGVKKIAKGKIMPVILRCGVFPKAALFDIRRRFYF